MTVDHEETDLRARILEITSETLDLAKSRLVPGALLGEDLCIDSLAATELALVLEDALGIVLPDDERTEVRTYGQVEDLVLRRIAMARAAGVAPSVGT